MVIFGRKSNPLSNRPRLVCGKKNQRLLSLNNFGQNEFFRSWGVTFLLGPKTFFGSVLEKMKVKHSNAI